MANSVICPSCGRPVSVPVGALSVTCPHPDCNQSFGVAASAAAMSQSAEGRPVLLDQLPISFLASPAMYAIVGAVAFVYGIVLFGVVSNHRRQEALAAEEARNQPKVVAHVPLPIESHEPSPAKATEPARTREPVAAKPPVDVHPPAEKSRPEPAPPVAETERPKPAPTSPIKKAETEKPATVPEPQPTANTTHRESTWGPLSGEAGDCSVQVDGTGLVLTVPGTLHVLSPELGSLNAPRLLTRTLGDFTAKVRVQGRILPGTEPLKQLPFTFHGAGLLIWQDEGNYLRFERIGMYSAVERKKLNQVLVELCKNGKTASTSARDVRDSDVLLRMERRGSEIRCSYSPDDGKTWLDVRRLNASFPAEVNVGVTAGNASPKSFPARLTDFELAGK